MTARPMRRAVASTWIVSLLVCALVVAGVLLWDQQRQQACTDAGWQPVRSTGLRVMCVDSDGYVRSPR